MEVKIDLNYILIQITDLIIFMSHVHFGEKTLAAYYYALLMLHFF